MKRIVKETLVNGTVQYRVESNRTFFGLIPCNWYTVTYHWLANSGDLIPCNAVFDTLEKAQEVAEFQNPNKKVVEKEYYYE